MVEKKRGCGFRKVGGLYLCSDGPTDSCHRLPFPLDICPTCKHGIKQSRGWTWIAPKLFEPSCEPEDRTVNLHRPANELHCAFCVICRPIIKGEFGLLWIGERFYKTPEDFLRESREMGVSRRIHKVPRNFKLGETWVLFAHAKAIPATSRPAGVNPETGAILHLEVEAQPGIFEVVRPTRLELLVKESDSTDEKRAELSKKGITPIVVPDDDRDHQGSVYDKEEEQELPLEKRAAEGGA